MLALHLLMVALLASTLHQYQHQQPVGSLPLMHADGMRMEVQLQLERQGGNNNDTANVKAVTYARLLIGSCSDDKILVNQSLIVETFASPYQVSFETLMLDWVCRKNT